MPWEKVTLVGVGLLGGSLGQALRARKLAQSVVGLVRREESVAQAVACQSVDLATLDPEEAVNGADLVVLCTPLETMPVVSRQILPFLSDGALLTDVGSVKRVVVQEMESLLKERNNLFVGSHPMAGKEKSGVVYASADLFEGAACVVTPGGTTTESALKAIEGLWKSVGGKPLRMEPSHHDRLVSKASHLPHVIAALLADYVLDPQAVPEQQALCAGGFRDTTRIAEGDIAMWQDILRQNAAPLSESLDEYINKLKAFKVQLDRGEHEQLTLQLKSARQRRRDWAR